MTIETPIIDNPQPQPGPSPTPTPKPAGALQIIAITSAVERGEGILTFASPIPQIHVAHAFMVLDPKVGDYYCWNDDYKWCESAEDYAARFPQT